MIMAEGDIKRSVTASEEWWARVTVQAMRERMTHSQWIIRAVDAYEKHGRYEPLAAMAKVSPIATGDRMLAALLSEGTIGLACIKLGTTREEWDAIVPNIPGLQRKIEVCFGGRHVD